jgi:peroxiredoxin
VKLPKLRSLLTPVMLIFLFTFTGNALWGEVQGGLQPGMKIPAIQLKDQDGNDRNFDSLEGPNGLLLLFNRSADWCPFCKSQMIDLESARQHFEEKGIRVATITYDSPAILKAFAQRRNIHYTMLSDPDSKTIDAFGIRNQDAKGHEAGIAIPNFYWIGRDGIIRQRHSEDTLLNRVTADYFYETLFGAGSALATSVPVVAKTPNLKLSLTQSDQESAPGARFRLTVRLEPGDDTHLYAPGAEVNGYHPIKLTLDPSDLYKTEPVIYPPSTFLEFPALKEKVPVFQSRTIVTDDVTAVRSPKTLPLFSAQPRLVIHGLLEYQACTSTECFKPETIPVEWTVNIKAADLDTQRVADGLQRK